MNNQRRDRWGALETESLFILVLNIPSWAAQALVEQSQLSWAEPSRSVLYVGLGFPFSISSAWASLVIDYCTYYLFLLKRIWSPKFVTNSFLNLVVTPRKIYLCKCPNPTVREWWLKNCFWVANPKHYFYLSCCNELLLKKRAK